MTAPERSRSRSKRGPLAAAASAAGLGGVLLLHAGSGPLVRAAPPPSTVPSGQPPATTSTVPPTGSTSPAAVRSAVGTAEQYGYGVLSVKVTVKGAHITDVSVVQLQTAEPYSQNLAQQVIPTLRGEVLSAQSAQVNGISGATYTSEAYAYSVQSALDQLHV